MSLLNLRAIGTLAAVLTALAVGSTAATACDSPRPYWKTVIAYEYVQKPCTAWVTRYDHCGRPYQTQITTYQTVRVAVERRVRVWG